MPIYEYRCGGCGFKKEYLQKLSDPLITDCPSCGKPQMVKLVSAAGFQLKGTGWYATDFKNARKAPADNKAPADKKAPAGDATAKGESTGSGDAKDAPKADAAAAPSCGAGACPACR